MGPQGEAGTPKPIEGGGSSEDNEGGQGSPGAALAGGSFWQLAQDLQSILTTILPILLNHLQL